MEKAVRKAGRYGIVDGYGGHGIGTEMHQDPHVLNHGRPVRGTRLVPGLALALHHLGKPAEAKEWLAKARQLVEEATAQSKGPTLTLPVECWYLIQFQVLYREAHVAIAGSPPDGALADRVQLSHSKWYRRVAAELGLD